MKKAFITLLIAVIVVSISTLHGCAPASNNKTSNNSEPAKLSSDSCEADIRIIFESGHVDTLHDVFYEELRYEDGSGHELVNYHRAGDEPNVILAHHVDCYTLIHKEK